MNHPLYTCWLSMRKRCLSPGEKSYSYYGGRGIGICQRWDDFAAFAADMGPRPPGHTLDRIDNNGNYEPSNCRWATRAEQVRNRRTSHIIEFNGKTQCLEDWGKETGVKANTIRFRVSRGWPLERALFERPGLCRSNKGEQP